MRQIAKIICLPRAQLIKLRNLLKCNPLTRFFLPSFLLLLLFLLLFTFRQKELFLPLRDSGKGEQLLLRKKKTEKITSDPDLCETMAADKLTWFPNALKNLKSILILKLIRSTFQMLFLFNLHAFASRAKMFQQGNSQNIKKAQSTFVPLHFFCHPGCSAFAYTIPFRDP